MRCNRLSGYAVLGLGLLLGTGLEGGMAAAAQEVAPADPVVGAADEGEAAELYNLRATFEFTVGSAYRWSEYCYEHTTLTWGEGDDAEVESNTFVEFGIISNSLVLAVDAEGDVTGERHIIDRLYLFEEDLVLAGTEILAARTDDGLTSYTINGQAVEDERMLYVLGKLIDLSANDYPSEEEVLVMLRVPEAPQPIGVEWEADGAAFLTAFLGNDADWSDGEITSRIAFTEVEEIFDTACVVFELEVELEGCEAFFGASEPAWDLLSNRLVIDATMKGPGVDDRLEGVMEFSMHLAQQWGDPETDRVGLFEHVTQGSKAQRPLSEAECELLGFDVHP